MNGNSVMAAIALVSIRYVDPDNAYRRQLADWYDEMLEDAPNIERVPTSPDCVSSRHLYQILVDNRDEVMLALNQAKIYPGVHYRDNTLYRMYRYAQGTCPRANTASERIISLPMHMRLAYSQIEYIAANLKDITRRMAS